MPNTDESHGLQCALEEYSRLVVVGLGGIGCALVQFLALFLNSLAIPVRLVLIDGDNFEPINADRQVFQILGKKAEVKASEIVQSLGTGEVTVAAVPEFLTPENIKNFLREGDYVFLCVDNHPTRKMVSEHCQTLANVTLLSGGNEGIDPPRERGTYGNVQIAIRKDGIDVAVPITQYHPEIAHATEKLPHQLGCTQIAQSTPQILFTNLAVASAMLNAFFAVTCGHLSYQEVKLDILDARMLPQFPLTTLK